MNLLGARPVRRRSVFGASVCKQNTCPAQMGAKGASAKGANERTEHFRFCLRTLDGFVKVLHPKLCQPRVPRLACLRGVVL